MQVITIFAVAAVLITMSKHTLAGDGKGFGMPVSPGGTVNGCEAQLARCKANHANDPRLTAFYKCNYRMSYCTEHGRWR